MKIFNIRISYSKILSIIIIIIACIFVLLAFIGFFKQVLSSNSIEITNENYANILTDSYDNIEKYLGKNISVVGYVFRLPDFGNNEFVIARDMLVDNNHSQVIGFLCNYNKISQYETNSWIKINGIIEKGHYFGEIPIIRVKSIKKVTTPNEIFAKPPENFHETEKNWKGDGVKNRLNFFTQKNKFNLSK